LCLSWWGPGLQELRSRLKKGQKAKCYYNPLDLGEIWVAHPDATRKPERAYATYPVYQNGLTLTEHNLLHQQFLAEGRQFDDSEADVALLLLRQRMSDDYEKSGHLRTHAKSKHTPSSPPQVPDNTTPDAIPGEIKQEDDDIPTFEVERL